jgi:hypothetical protein
VSRGIKPPVYDRRTGGSPSAFQPAASSPCMARSYWLLGAKMPRQLVPSPKRGIADTHRMALDITQEQYYARNLCNERTVSHGTD